jgi:hypothetical protein
MTGRLATVPAESTAYRPQPMLEEHQEDTLRVDQVKTSSAPQQGDDPPALSTRPGIYSTRRPSRAASTWKFVSGAPSSKSACGRPWEWHG